MIITKHFLINVFIALFFFISSFSFVKANNHLAYQDLFFDVVEKKIKIDETFPLNFKDNINKWFSKNIKVNGFDGDVSFSLYDYEENIFNIENGKKVELLMSFLIEIKKNDQNSSSEINGKVNSYSSMTGNFSLNDFDQEVINTQNNLILQLNQKLKNFNFSKN